MYTVTDGLKRVKCAINDINSSTKPPTYFYRVDYIDAMCFSASYKAVIPTTMKIEFRDLSDIV